MADGQDQGRPLGEVIRRARVLQQRSQADVAASLGYHQSKLSRLENGHGTEDTRVLRAVAAELAVPLHHLGLAPPTTPPTADHEAEDMRRRTFLAGSAASLAAPSAPPAQHHRELVRALLPGLPSAPSDHVPSLPQLSARVSTARRLFCTCDYAELGRILPPLIDDLRQAARAADSAPAGTVTGLLATAYQTLTGLLLKLGDGGSAWMAVGRAMAEGERSGDPVVLASSVRVQAHALARGKHSSHAIALVRHTADQMTGAYDRRSPRYLAALGLMLLRGVTAASGAGDRAATQEFLGEASEVARHVALDRPDAWANFSPTNVQLHAVSAAVALGDTGVALETAQPLMGRRIPVPERRSALWVEAARAYSQQGRLADGYRAVRIAESCAAQDIRRPAVRELVADMAARDRRRALPELHHFSRQLGVPA
ncbi:helix-turn-helix domain-containing protein [Streptomyces coffeae]|uniref:Helix-turn-helix transcriptional regulator n=1 Tax=Streptomyces coffeae TaxID=621382 RepID=A0ABS1N7N0_9ACTN|nr:helix-turn-helix transcriptional regulator [Streptomyces coffeae]MBL1096079.1 helix-turn-helix transcriptional regulator [Streptomyces coffeae]